MSEQIIPVFADVQSQTAAQALSEPFVNPEDFTWAHQRTSQYIGPLDTDKLAAIGTSYIGDNGQTEFIYAMHPLVQAPYAATQAFMTGYDARITPNHAICDETQDKLGFIGSTGLDYLRNSAIDYVKKARLKTIGSFVVFAAEQSLDFISGFVVSNTIIDELPLQGREELFRLEQEGADFMRLLGSIAGVSEERRDEVDQMIKQNRDQASFSLYVAALHMPRMPSLRRTIDEYPFVSDFATMPRKARRDLLRTEQKSLRQQQS
jgi:hypothetical protein